jgi:cell division protein FtsI/penicillin-binding protein 2
MALLLFIIIMAIITAILFWVQAVVYEKWYEREDEEDEDTR